MSDTVINPIDSQAGPAPAPASGRVMASRMAVVGALLTVAAWITLMLNAYGVLAVSVAAIIVSAIGIRACRRWQRNLAITSVIAASVLLVVLSALLIALYVYL